MSVPAPTLGPCESWIESSDVASCCGADVDPPVFDPFAYEASQLMFELSGRQYTGLCAQTVRPCRTRGSCWDLFGPGGSWSGGWAWSAFGGWAWWDDQGTSRVCGCSPLDRIKLAGYPVREILEVTIDGVVVDAATYRLAGWRYLERTAGVWPGCQNMAAAEGAAGSFVVSYRHGVSPPESGRRAAIALACELYKSCQANTRCLVPQGATKVTRQGVTVERQLLKNWLGSGKPSGILEIDAFLAAYNPGEATRRPAVWSPDIDPYPQRVL